MDGSGSIGARMKRSVRRILLPMILLVAGGSTLIHGVVFRTLPVWADEMVSKEKTILEAPPKELYRPRPFGRGGGMELPPPPPRPRKVKVQEPEPRLGRQAEYRVMREVSVGGIARAKDGNLQLTYGPGKAGPALCPT